MYYLILRVSYDFCAAYLYYFSNLTKILRSLEVPMQLVPATASCRPSPIKIQWWHSCSGRPPATVDPPALPCPHRFHLTDQACPSKPFLNQHVNLCETYLPLQFIFEPTCQSNPCETVPLFLNRLPAPPIHFRTYVTSAVSQYRHSSSYHLPLQDIF